MTVLKIQNQHQGPYEEKEHLYVEFYDCILCDTCPENQLCISSQSVASTKVFGGHQDLNGTVIWTLFYDHGGWPQIFSGLFDGDYDHGLQGTMGSKELTFLVLRDL